MVRAALLLLVLGAVMLVAAGITAAIGSSVTQSIRDTYGSTTYAYLAAQNATVGIGNLANQLGNVGTVLGAAAILAVIFGVLFAVVGGKGTRE